MALQADQVRLYSKHLDAWSEYLNPAFKQFKAAGNRVAEPLPGDLYALIQGVARLKPHIQELQDEKLVKMVEKCSEIEAFIQKHKADAHYKPGLFKGPSGLQSQDTLHDLLSLKPFVDFTKTVLNLVKRPDPPKSSK